uniref:Palmitoyltransferase n=1 Tax=Theileria parva TaxID=5875 RepID=Q4N462_THEPA|eukprot:XP_765344.1 hypothetical protein [Theileria parva strain Muguga]
MKWSKSKIGFAIFVYILIYYSLFGSFLILFSKIINFKEQWYIIFLVLYFPLVAVITWTYHVCITSNPGFIPLITVEEIGEFEEYFEFCEKCNSSRPIGSHHCKTCKKCILKMDHHCVWITNCVGLCNQKYFIQFLVYLELMCIFNLLIILVNIVDLVDKDYHLDSYIFERNSLYFIFVNFLISVLFLLFVCIILINQIWAIVRGNSKIDELKKIKFKKLTMKENLREQTLGNHYKIRSHMTP